MTTKVIKVILGYHKVHIIIRNMKINVPFVFLRQAYNLTAPTPALGLRLYRKLGNDTHKRYTFT